MRAWLQLSAVVLAASLAAAAARAQQPGPAAGAGRNGGVLELRFVPAANAQIAIWIERGDGEFLSTVRLTEAVALRGIGNRPGASQMNSGFRWPYGRREGALPLWAARRASAPGAQRWQRVIFQDRWTEGLASKTANDQSLDDYYCLSFDEERSKRDALDAVSCASVFSSDKGRFMTETDFDSGYAEPYQATAADPGTMRKLPLQSLYPPRRDAMPCKDSVACYDHRDLARFAQHAREVMPEIDAVTMATPVGGEPQSILYAVPAQWGAGDYRACLEINVEGDYDERFNDQTLPTPERPEEAWDIYALMYGYPYRGQPSVLYCVELTLGDEQERSFSTASAEGSAGTWDQTDASFGELHSMDGIVDEPERAPGSGADRLRHMPDGSRLLVNVKPPDACTGDEPPGAVGQLAVERLGDRLHAHEWAELRFLAADDDGGVQRYDVRISTAPIDDDQSFMAAMPAKAASIAAPELRVPTDAEAGELVTVDFGGMVAETHYYVAVRAIDGCARPGPIASTEISTPKREFATVTPCFIATAAFGSPLAEQVGALRRLRDRELQSSAAGRVLVDGYYRVGPVLADAIRDRPWLRGLARAVLTPIVDLARRWSE